MYVIVGHKVGNTDLYEDGSTVAFGPVDNEELAQAALDRFDPEHWQLSVSEIVVLPDSATASVGTAEQSDDAPAAKTV